MYKCEKWSRLKVQLSFAKLLIISDNKITRFPMIEAPGTLIMTTLTTCTQVLPAAGMTNENKGLLL